MKSILKTIGKSESPCYR